MFALINESTHLSIQKPSALFHIDEQSMKNRMNSKHRFSEWLTGTEPDLIQLNNQPDCKDITSKPLQRKPTG